MQFVQKQVPEACNGVCQAPHGLPAAIFISGTLIRGDVDSGRSHPRAPFIPSESLPAPRRWYALSFAMCIFWIGLISYLMVEFAIHLGRCLAVGTARRAPSHTPAAGQTCPSGRLPNIRSQPPTPSLPPPRG